MTPNIPGKLYAGSCWFEAVAYARWLDARLREKNLLPADSTVRLPTEGEWEKAARGGDGREFPWGRFESGRANIDDTWGNAGPHKVDQTTPVGVYPTGASPCGALDMAGNVWEWCLNEYGIPERSGIEGDAARVVRGGSWSYGRDSARCACRYYFAPDDRNFDIGFRLVCVSPIR